MKTNRHSSTVTPFAAHGRRFSTVEPLEDRIAPAAILITGTSGNDHLVVNATGPDSGTYQLTSAGVAGPVVAFTGTSSFTFDAGAGTDVLTINNPAVGLFAPAGGIDYYGGGNFGDALEMLGGTATDQVYNIKNVPLVAAPAPGAPGALGAAPVIGGDGEFFFTGTNNLRLSFTGLAPIIDTVSAASLTVNSTDGANTISITNGSASRLIVAVDTSEPIEFINKTNLIVNGGDGVAGGDAGDTVLLNFTNTPAGLSGITINGDEGDDTINVQARSASVPLTLNGGASTAGDRLNVTTPAEINVFNNLATPTSVTMNAAGTAVLVSNSFERSLFTPGNGIVNLLGDNNGGIPGQADSFTVVGRDTDSSLGGDTFGTNEFSLLLNGSAPIDFRDVNVLGVASAGGDDDIVIDPYADTVRSWGIVTNVDAGAGDDDLFYGNTNAHPVIDPTPDGSQAAFNEAVVVDATLIPGAGSITVPGAVTISFQGTEDLSFLLTDGSLGDADTLTIRTPDAAGVPETVTIRPDAAGNDAEPLVDIDATVGVQLLQIENLAVVDQANNQFFALAMSFEGRNGNDTFVVTPSGNGTAINIDGGNPSDADTVVITGTNNAADAYTVLPGGTPDAGTINVTGRAAVQFTRTEAVQIDGGGGTGADSVTFQGTGANNTFTLVGTGAASGTARVDAGPLVTFTNLGTGSTLNLNGLPGDDLFSVTPGGLAATTTINVTGGDPAASDTVIVNGSAGVDTLTYAPTSFDAGSLTGLGAAINFTTIEAVKYFGGDTGGLDNLTINGTITDDRLTIQAGLEFRGTFRSFFSPDFDFIKAGRLTFNGGGSVDSVSAIGDEGVDNVSVAGSGVSINTEGALFIVTLGTSVELLDIDTRAGNDTVNLTGLPAPTVATVRGGEGNDTLIGSAQADLLYGGAGNDVLIGGAGVDFAYGEDGNDRFGDPAVADPAANDAGNDSFFGGAGSDTFVWDAGDGSDLIEGGEGNDSLIFNGSAGVETFTLNAVGTRFELLRSLGAIDMDLAGVEQANVNAGGGADSFVVGDLFATELLAVNLNFGPTDGTGDQATINGRSTADTLAITSPTAGSASVRGLRYDVNLLGAETADRLNVLGNAGHDTIDVAGGTAAVLGVTISGGDGDDTLSGDASTINGEAGNDTLIGSANDNAMDGGAGDDTFLGNGGADNLGGGLNTVGDVVLIPGTAGNDTLALALDSAGRLVTTINGVTTTYGNFLGGAIATSGIERLRVEGWDGDDALTVDSTNGALTVPTTYDGGASSDSLILTGGTATSDTYTPGPALGTGTSVIVIGGITQTVSFTGIEPVIDLVAGPLVVNANDAANSIGYTVGRNNANTANDTTRGRVNIDAQEFITFSNKTTLTINALGGDDTISLNNPNTPTGLTGITVTGGDPSASDKLIVAGTGAADTFTFAGTSLTDGSVTRTGAVPVTYTQTEDVLLDGLGGADTFLLASAVGRIQVKGGEGSDTVSFTGAASGVIFDLDAVGVAQNVNATGELVVLGDVLENFIGTAFNDILYVDASFANRTINGGPHATNPPGDRFFFDARGLSTTLVPVDANTGTISVRSLGSLSFDEFETRTVMGSVGGGGGFGTPGSSDAFTTAHVYDLTQPNTGGKPVLGKSPTAVATGDLNGDGFADMVVVNSKTKNLGILINKGDGTFLDVQTLSTVTSNPQDLVLGDFDGDGFLDAVVTHPVASKFSFFKGDGAGSFGAPVATATTKFKPFAIAAADLDGDTDLDLAITSRDTSAIAIMLGNGAGSFTVGAPIKTLGRQPVDIVIADFNGDGSFDLATANAGTNNVNLFRGDGAGGVSDPVRFAAGVRPGSLAAADFDDDGDLDLAVTNASSRFVSILLSAGSVAATGQFAPQLNVALAGTRQPSAIVVGDFDGDGLVDLGLGNRLDTKFTVLRGLGAGFFSQPFDIELGKDPKFSLTGGVALADFNNDGLLDVVATSLASSDVRVLLRRA